ncbi:MAG: NAD(P)-binding domain-containing protein [Desulfobacterales bacterium]|nr:NAD(P)-binding domain-containing protein [Desulfobacterales bacterium]
MQIGILGSGNMGRTLGSAWAGAGHAVFFGSRDPEKGKSLAETVGHGSTGGANDEAVEFGEVVFQTVRSLPSAFLKHPHRLCGKVLVDCNNRPVPEDLVFGPPPIPSFAERLADDVAGVEVVKALNTMAQEIFDHPPQKLREYRIACFLAGDDAAKAKVAELVSTLGLAPVDCGPLGNAWMLEAAGDLIRHVIISGKRWYATFGIAEPPAAPSRFGGRKETAYK